MQEKQEHMVFVPKKGYSRLMTSLLIQFVSLSVIAIILVFPKPDLLKLAFMEPSLESIRSTDDHDVLVVSTPRSIDGATKIQTPANFGCGEPGSGSLNQTLTDCAENLVVFLEAAQDHNPRIKQARFFRDPPNPLVEQARLALSEICRLQWVSEGVSIETDSLCTDTR